MQEADAAPEIASSSAHDTLLIKYTSGTTGLPKGAKLTHGNIFWNNVNANLAFGAKNTDVLLTAAPLFHIGGLNVMTISAFQMGSPLVLLRHFEPEAVLQAIERTRCLTCSARRPCSSSCLSTLHSQTQICRLSTS